MIDHNDLLTPDEVATRLKVRKSWVFEKTRRRSQDPLPCLRIGRYIRFNWPDVEQWLARHQSNGLESPSIHRVITHRRLS
jgi:excisionase family DNA binding protein